MSNRGKVSAYCIVPGTVPGIAPGTVPGIEPGIFLKYRTDLTLRLLFV